jgi:glycosyltransferase involved in cell wall biosynthesis
MTPDATRRAGDGSVRQYRDPMTDAPSRTDANGATAPREVLLVSSVRVEPLETLAAALTARGTPTRIVSAFTDTAWRDSRGGGVLAATRARLSGLLFPVTIRVGRRHRGRVVVATTNPFWLPAMLVLRGARPMVTLVYDVYPDALEVRWSLPRWLSRVVAAVFGHGLHRADAIVVLGERVRSALLDRHALPCPVVVIPTGADPRDFTGQPRREDPRAPAEGEVLLSYVGNTGSVHDGRTLGLALAAALRANPSAVAVVATRGDRAAELLAPLIDAPRVTLRNGLDDDTYRSTLERSDIALVTLDAGAGIASVPSKIYPALAAGCAVLAIAPTDSDLADVVRTSGAGIVVDPGDIDGATTALSRLIGDAELRSLHGRAARRAAEQYTPTVLVARWEALIEPLLDSQFAG